MLVLHRNEGGQSIVECVGYHQYEYPLRERERGNLELTLHQLELPGPTTTHSDIPDPTSLDDIMQRLHGLFNRCFRVESVELEYVNVFQLKPFERVLHRGKDSLFRQSHIQGKGEGL